jgi:23S rRNA (uracil1939-C5)-methyltransferase
VRNRKKNIVLEKITVEDYAAEGKCLSRVDGKVIFIERVVPGDLVDVRITKNKKDWAEGYPIHFHAYAPDRLDPFCKHFGVCGGCQWQMLPYEKQLEFKNRQVVETLKRIGKVTLPTIEPIAGASETIRYRNKIEYTFGNKRYLQSHELNDPTISSSDNVAGFHARGFFDKIVDIETCYLQDEPTNEIRLAIKKLAKQEDWSYYDIREHVGFLRNMQIRLCTTGELMVNVVVAENDKKKINKLMEFLEAEFPAITTLLYTINTKWNDSIFDLTPVVFKGKGFVIETLTEKQSGKTYQFKIGPTSFFQTNTKQAEKLYQITHDFAECNGTQTVYDLYCGTGSIGIFLSQQVKNLVGVELIDAAIEDAKENAKLNNIESASFYAGDVIKICNDDFFAKHGRPDVIITDPPRAGMHQDLINKLLEINAPTIVYVSCNPSTQARDIQLLNEAYEVTKIQPVDMFPHTLHIENVIQLKRRN